MRICVGVWVQYLFLLPVVYDVKFSPPDDKVCKRNGLGYVIIFVPRKNGSCTKAPVGEAENYPYGLLIT